MVNLDVAWEFIRHYEGCESAFYQDSSGYVTYGCGNHALLSQAILLRWETQGRDATDTEVESDYKAVRAAPGGHVASWYRGYSRCRLGPDSIRKLFNDRVEEFTVSLRGCFPGYESMPPQVQLALLDMAFNLGIGKLLKDFPTFVKAIKLGHYDLAAKECHRQNPDPSVEKWDAISLHEQRQCKVRDMLLSAGPR